MAISRYSAFFLACIMAHFLTGCVTAPVTEPLAPRPKKSVSPNTDELEAELGLSRAPSDLGFRERSFNPCNYGPSQSCDFKYYTVVRFQLLCRDTEGTVSEIPRSLSPIYHPDIRWKLAGQSGQIPTDRNGYGRVRMISSKTTRGKRLILKKGPHFVGVDVSELSKLVLPRNWCESS